MAYFVLPAGTLANAIARYPDLFAIYFQPATSSSARDEAEAVLHDVLATEALGVFKTKSAAAQAHDRFRSTATYPGPDLVFLGYGRVKRAQFMSGFYSTRTRRVWSEAPAAKRLRLRLLAQDRRRRKAAKA